MKPSVELRGITKRFESVLANDNVNFVLKHGEIHSIVGSNGAGKSTLVKILYGILRPDAGEIFINGIPQKFQHPRDSKKHQIGMVHQEMLLVEADSALNNIILGEEPVRYGFIQYAEAEKTVSDLITRYNLNLDLHRKVHSLSVGERQRILIARLLYQESNILILDEPTAALAPQETDTLFSVLTALKEAGASIIFISHKLPEVMRFSDRISVMRNGKLIKTLTKDETESGELMELMCGDRPPEVNTKQRYSESELPLLKLNNISCESGSRPLKGINLTVNEGEITGLLGVDGNGQKELEEILSGQAAEYSGEILFRNVPVPKGNPRVLKETGFGYIPSHREKNGIITDFTVAENIILGRHKESGYPQNFFLQKQKAGVLSERLIEEYDIQPPDSGALMLGLSGGNRQKVVLGRELHSNPPVLIACNPTRGVDIQTSYNIYNRLINLAESGSAVLLILSDVIEAMLLCHRIAVLYNGEIRRIFEQNEFSETELGYYMTGGEKP